MDEHNLQRFVDAQDLVYERVIAELAAGEKRSHWMWFIFPQIKGLSTSFRGVKFAIGSRDEGLAYLDHPVLGARLRQCTEVVTALTGRSAYQIFGSPDCVKFQSCMTLFSALGDEPDAFRRALDMYFGGERDPRTLEQLAAWGPRGPLGAAS